MKKIVTAKIYAPSLEMIDLKGSPEQIFELFKEEQKLVAEMYSVVDPNTITFSTEYYGYDGGTELYVEFPREESNAEYNARMKKEEKAARKTVQKEAKERAKYEELKAKYGE